MKKYRPIKLLIILLAVILLGILLGGFLLNGWKRIVVIAGTSVIVGAFILGLTYFIQFRDDKVVIKHGLSSFNKSYHSNLKTRHILHADIYNISINYSNKYVIISLKNGANIMLTLNGYFSSYEIMKEFEKINNKIQCL